MTALALLCALCVPAGLRAQAAGQPAATASTPQVSPAHPKQATKRAAHGHKAKPETVQPAVVDPPRPPDPPPPNWPVNNQAAAATVDWNGRDLTIAASNSSLQQILRDVSTATGVKMQGIGGGDQRIYGSYGPATARDVLSQLLEGSGYNVLMVGDSGEGTPRELVLTTKTSKGTPAQEPGANAEPGQSADDEAPEEPEQPEQPDPNVQQRRPPGFPPQLPGQTREQIMQQMQMRQIQEQQLQQQQQQNQQPPPQFPNQQE